MLSLMEQIRALTTQEKLMLIQEIAFSLQKDFGVQDQREFEALEAVEMERHARGEQSSVKEDTDWPRCGRASWQKMKS